MILDGKKVVVTGVLTDDSIAYSVARVAQEQGAEREGDHAPGLGGLDDLVHITPLGGDGG